jgi:hypothetical protein
MKYVLGSSTARKWVLPAADSLIGIYGGDADPEPGAKKTPQVDVCQVQW